MSPENLSHVPGFDDRFSFTVTNHSQTNTCWLAPEVKKKKKKYMEDQGGVERFHNVSSLYLVDLHATGRLVTHLHPLQIHIV